MKKTVMAAVVSGIMATLTALAAEGWLASVYRHDNMPLNATIASVYTNGPERVTLASVLANCPNATGTWTIAIVADGITNVIKSGAVSLAVPTLVYEGNGMLPLGAGAQVLFSGSIHTNIMSTNIFSFAINTRQ